MPMALLTGGFTSYKGGGNDFFTFSKEVAHKV